MERSQLSGHPALEPPEGDSGVSEVEDVFSVEDRRGFVDELSVAGEGCEGRGEVLIA